MVITEGARRNGKAHKLAEYIAGTLTAKENDKPEFVEMKRAIIDHASDDMVMRVLRIVNGAIPATRQRETLYTLAKVGKEGVH